MSPVVDPDDPSANRAERRSDQTGASVSRHVPPLGRLANGSLAPEPMVGLPAEPAADRALGPATEPAGGLVCVVDLDNTLLRTDLLHESLFHGLSTAPFATLMALGGLLQSRAVLKDRLATLAAPDIATLPLNDDVLAEVAAARASGRRTALVSASDQRLVTAVAARVGCFDEAYGSDGVRNLGGAAKATFLVERYGAGNFSYLGDAWTDLAVWARAGEVVTVGAGRRLRAAADTSASEMLGNVAAGATPRPVRHLSPPDQPALWRARLRALRPHQWLKNLLVFLPAFAGHQADAGVWSAAFVAFIAFSLTASSVYVLNDLLDLSADRAHARKRLRPFAVGAVPIRDGVILAAGLLATAGLLAVLAADPLFIAVLGIYYLLTFAYSLTLKRRLMIDICALAGLYTLRVIGGAAATGLALSPWMLAFSAFLFLSLAAMKRQTELVDGLRSGKTRAVGRAYQVDDLPIVAMMAVASGYISVLVLALYVSSPEVRVLYASPLILWGICPVLLYWISRLVMVSHRGEMADDPVVFAVRDPVSLACGAAIFGVALLATLV